MNDLRENEIDLLELVRTLWKNILAIALVAMLFGCAAFGYTAFLVAPQYEATVSLYVNNSSFSLGATNFSVSSADLSTSNSLVSAYVYILKSRTTMEEVIREAQLDYSPDALVGMISTKSATQTGAFEVTVTSTNPAEVELIANTIAAILPDRIAEIVDGTSVRVVDYAIIPSHRSGPDIMHNTLMGILVGGGLCVVLIALKFVLDDSNKVMVRSVDDLRSMYPDIMVLATIPDMRVPDKKSSYYSFYYKESESRKKEAKRNGRREDA